MGLEPRSWGAEQLLPAERSCPGPSGQFLLLLLEICSWKPLAGAKFLPPNKHRWHFNVACLKGELNLPPSCSSLRGFTRFLDSNELRCLR